MGADQRCWQHRWAQQLAQAGLPKISKLDFLREGGEIEGNSAGFAISNAELEGCKFELK